MVVWYLLFCFYCLCCCFVGQYPAVVHTPNPWRSNGLFPRLRGFFFSSLLREAAFIFPLQKLTDRYCLRKRFTGTQNIINIFLRIYPQSIKWSLNKIGTRQHCGSSLQKHQHPVLPVNIIDMWKSIVQKFLHAEFTSRLQLSMTPPGTCQIARYHWLASNLVQSGNIPRV